MGREVYALLLLISLLAGSELRVQEKEGPGCRFLGSSGCMLKFKPFICINYRCRKMAAEQSPEESSTLEHATRAVLSQIVALEELLYRELEGVASG